jgi:hypothetical protein
MAVKDSDDGTNDDQNNDICDDQVENEINDQYNFGDSNNQSNYINFDNEVAYYDDRYEDYLEPDYLMYNNINPPHDITHENITQDCVF